MSLQFSASLAVLCMEHKDEGGLVRSYWIECSQHDQQQEGELHESGKTVLLNLEAAGCRWDAVDRVKYIILLNPHNYTLSYR